MSKKKYKAYTIIDNATGQEANIKDFTPSWWDSKRNLKWNLKQDGTLQIENDYEIEFVNADRVTIVFNDGSVVNESGDSNAIKNEILNLLQKVLDLVKRL